MPLLRSFMNLLRERCMGADRIVRSIQISVYRLLLVTGVRGMTESLVSSILLISEV